MRFCVDVKIYGTAYVEAARRRGSPRANYRGGGLCRMNFREPGFGRARYRPWNGVALSPVFTAYGMAEGATWRRRNDHEQG